MFIILEIMNHGKDDTEKKVRLIVRTELAQAGIRLTRVNVASFKKDCIDCYV